MEKINQIFILSLILSLLTSCVKKISESDNEKIDLAIAGLSTICSLNERGNDFLIQPKGEYEVKSYNLPLTSFNGSIDFSKT